MIYTLVDLFNTGMKRNYPDALEDKDGYVLNLGAGKKQIDDSIPIDWPWWDANVNPIPAADNSVDMIHCYHLLEHLEDPRKLISEINRVLKPSCHANIVVPYFMSRLQACDLDHKHAFAENTIANLFKTQDYEKGKLTPMRIHTNFIMGDCLNNLCLVMQLVSEE